MIEDLCGSKFWDTNITWNTDNPTLTPCFEKTVMVWVPCAYLWLAAVLESYRIFSSKKRISSWNAFSIIKLTLTCVLMLIKIVDIIVVTQKEDGSVNAVDYLSATILLATLALSATLLWYHRKHGLTSSGVLFFFWLLLLLCGLSQFRSEIINQNQTYVFISYLIYYVLVLCMFVLNCFADTLPSNDNSKAESKQVPNPESAASVPSGLTFSWFDPLALTGFRRTLVEEDLWALDQQDSSAELVSRFHKYWNKSPHNGKLDKIATYTSDSVVFDTEPNKKKKSILPVLAMAFGGPLGVGAFYKLCIDILMFIPPQLLRLFIDFTGGEGPVWRGYLYAVGLFACASVQTLILGQYFMTMFRLGMKLRSAIVGVVYRKSLRMSNFARKESTLGEIVNLMSVDASKVMELMPYLNLIWSGPFQITLCVYFLWSVLGPSVLAGLAVMILLIPVNSLIANRIGVLQRKQMKWKDERVKLMNEILNGIKVLKMYAWEPSFEQQILNIRDQELNVLKQTAYLNAATGFVWACAPFMVSITSFGCYVLVDEANILDAKTTFVALALFNILRFPLSMLPNLISNLVQTSISVKRLSKFMNCDELDRQSVEHEPNQSHPLLIESGDFSWDDKEGVAVLKNIHLQISHGSLVAVVGLVGSGKSSLLSAFLGEMTKIKGRINTIGSSAYVPQQAWIQNATLQDNILFGKYLDKAKYNKVIKACALRKDLEMLPGGDLTEIGEKGINLSGGQKQRVALARAIYFDADNYFLDDPLSAVDSHVGKHIFDKVIGPSGLLNHKTRLWVTNSVSYLSQTDMIVVLRNGEISEAGSYQQLLQKKGAFADYLLQHLSDSEKSTTEELDEFSEDLQILGTEIQKIKRNRSASESASETEFMYSRTNSVKRDSLDDNKKQVKAEENKLIDAEKRESGKVKWSVYHQYFKSVGVITCVMTYVIYLGVEMFRVLANFWLVKWSNDGDNMVINGTANTALRDHYLGVYGGLGVGQAIMSFLASLVLNLGCWRAAKILHVYLLSNMLRAPLQFFEVTPLGRILSRFSKDIDVLDSTLPRYLFDFVFASVQTLTTLVVISWSTPIFQSVIIPITIVYFLIQRFYVGTSRQLKRIESVTRSPVYSHFGESVTGASSIRAYGVTDRFAKESDVLMDYNQSFYFPSCVANRWLSIRLEMIGNLIILFAAIFAVRSRDSITPGLVGMSIGYSLEITQILNWVVRMTSEIESNIVAVERIKEYAETKKEAAWTTDKKPHSSWPETGALDIRGLTLGYREDSPAIREIDCTIAPREKIGIVGRTGAGKSTLTLGLFRIVEAMGGKITIDGVDISSIGLHQLRSRITIIPQDPVLFSGTLRMNLDPFDCYSDHDIWTALEHAHLSTYVRGLNSGLYHMVSEGGENLSVGQRQLVCLARALLRKTRLLVMDEATAAVDLETDDLIQKTIRSEFASCTVLTIAHRLNTIMDSTRVMVLDRGQLVEFAPPAQLLQDRASIFYGMAKDAGLVT